MDFVGKSLKKEFKGHGVFEGVIQSYDSTTGFCKIVYEDGESEEIDLSEVNRLLTNTSSVSEEMAGKKVGRKPKRRRRNGPCDPGKFDGGFDVNDGNLCENLVVQSQLGQNLENNAVDLDVKVNVNVSDCVTGNEKVDNGLDLNREFEFDDGIENGGAVGCIDLNVSVEASGFDEDGIMEKKVESLGEGCGEEVKIEREFDLNLGFNDGGTNGVNGSVDVEVRVSSGEELRIGDSGGNFINADSNGSDGQSIGVHLEIVTPIQCEDDNSGRRKRRKVERKLSSPSKTVLRRSARRAKAAVSADSTALSDLVEVEVNDLAESEFTEVSEKRPVALSVERLIETDVTPSKIDLPPSSTNLNLEGIPVADLFSVYSSLRLFSTLLYLSPFELDDFVAALKSTVSNLLLDFIHVSILQTLRKHLEALANEGCESASTCLRNLNWNLLDEITWPVFMVEYLLIHGSPLKPGFSLNQLKLLDGDYYKQPADVKLELLRCLCDDVVEVESIRVELNRRRIMADVNREGGKTDVCRRRKISLDTSGDLLLSEDVEDDADGNSDECCLCKMDGNLICCDGCPAAYHSKCVGIISNLLPEGDWYCPECVISRRSAATKPQKSSQGAELLGIDPCGRLFFSCFDYLLVSDSYDADSSFSYYHKDDLGSVIQLLQSSNAIYGSILSAISKEWVILTDLDQQKGSLESENRISTDTDFVGRNTKSSVVECLSHEGIECSDPSDLSGAHTKKHCTVAESPLTSSEGSDEVLQANGVVKNSHRLLSNVTARGTSAKRISASKRKNKKQSSSGKSISSKLNVKEDGLDGSSGYAYTNSYRFAHTAASVVEELLRKPSDKVCVGTPKTEEQIISIQMKLILMKSTKLCWTTILEQNGEGQSENCGWCYCCRFLVADRGCLFDIKKSRSIPLALKADVDSILSKRNIKGHLVDVICYILCLEERLRGLLLGPWLSPRYSELWRNRVLNASDVSSLKHPLFMMVSHLRPTALSADWWKHVDSVATMGSSSHFDTSSRVNSKNVISRRKGRNADTDTKPSTDGKGLSLFWWRGGRTSRNLFNWKVIPRSLALRAARKAGCMKIPDLLYSDSSVNTRRSKYATWQAALEAAVSSEQLALQVRDLELFIRWDDIENTYPHFLLDKESLKSVRLFKKVIIRRKSVQGSAVKYLLDFGKRRSIPEVVIKHGCKLEDSDSEKKRYWLDESHVPLYLIKNYEERRMVRKAGKMITNKGRKVGRVMTKTSRKKDFEYLFLKAERADHYQCGHCNKNVPISEAVTCQHCNGFFHKRHVMKSSEGVTAKCTYACHRCRSGKQVKTDRKQGSRKLGKLRNAKKLKVDRKRLAVSKANSKKGRKPLPRDQRMLLRNAKKSYTHERINSKKFNSHEQQNAEILNNHEQQKGEKLKKRVQRVGKKLSNDEQRSSRKLNHNVQPLVVETADTTSNPEGITLRRSARKSKNLTLQSDVLGTKRMRNDGSSGTSEKGLESSIRKRRRTLISRSFWINGLHLSTKPNDERVSKFKRKKLFVESESSAGLLGQPKCPLCHEPELRPALVYIACDLCGDWFHGEAFGLNQGNIESVIGFKCHVCLERDAPICPFVAIIRNDNVEDTSGQHTQFSPEDASHMEKAGLVKDRDGEAFPDGLVSTQGNTDGDRSHHDSQLLDSELKMGNTLHGSMEVTSDSIVSQGRESPANMSMGLDKNSVFEGMNTKLNVS